MGSITQSAKDVAEQYDDIELRVAEGTNDVNLQISQVETFINDGVDAIVLLPFDGAAMTPIALKAMEAGIPVINVDREFDDPNAARVTVLGDNYGMGVSAGQFVCDNLDGKTDAVVAEIAGIDSLPLTQDRSQGFEDALAECDQNVDNRVAADFTVEGGEEAGGEPAAGRPADRLPVEPRRRPGCRRLAAIENAGRDEFIMIGGAGSKNAMEAHPVRRQRAQGDGHLPVDPGRRRHQAGPAAGPGEVDERPGRGRGAAHGAALRAGRDRGQRRPVHRHRVRVLIESE